MIPENPAFARTGHTAPGGKMTRRLDIPCTEDAEEAVIAFAYLTRKPKAELAREALDIGLAVMRHMHDKYAQVGFSSRSDQSTDHSHSGE